MNHVIAAVTFTHGQRGDDATLVCTCSWEGRAGDFPDHRSQARAGRGRRELPKGRRPIPWSIDGRRGPF